MTTTALDLYRSVRTEQFPNGTVFQDGPAPEVLYPDFEPRFLPSGKVRAPDVEMSDDKQWVKAGGGTSLFDRPGVFKSRGWVAFEIPAGTIVPEPLVIRRTGYNKVFQASSPRANGKETTVADVSGRALVVLIQLLDEKIWEMKGKVEKASPDDDGLADLEEELATCTAVADELRDSYQVAVKAAGNLPPYGSLVRFGTV